MFELDVGAAFAYAEGLAPITSLLIYTDTSGRSRRNEMIQTMERNCKCTILQDRRVVTARQSTSRPPIPPKLPRIPQQNLGAETLSQFSVDTLDLLFAPLKQHNRSSDRPFDNRNDVSLRRVLSLTARKVNLTARCCFLTTACPVKSYYFRMTEAWYRNEWS